MESERGSRFLFGRVFFTRSGIHFARKRSKAGDVAPSLQDRE
jgi:hypothetical protein